MRGRQSCLASVLLGLSVSCSCLADRWRPVKLTDRRLMEPIRPPAQPASARLSFEDLVYQGAFRVPEESNGESFSYGGQTLAYNPVSNTLFVGSLHDKVAEVSIPSPVKTTRRGATAGGVIRPAVSGSR